ncbi:MAG: hypothetical protein Q4C95_08730 [Planctomycetia bacterium]|nr:hypothetical protein [Planctomycetia bacterium]
MSFKDRIKELRRVKAKTLLQNPFNWRTHPENQKALLQNVLEDIGFADALLVRENDDGNLVLIDGHLRAEIDPEQFVPVLILDVTANEANKLLLTHDPISEMANSNHAIMQKLTNVIENLSRPVNDYVQNLLNEADKLQKKIHTVKKPLIVHDVFQVIVECSSEDEQKEIYDEFVSKGKKCKLLSI